MKKIIILLSALVLSTSAFAAESKMEVSVGAGWAFNFIDTGDTTDGPSKNGLAFGGHFLMDPGLLEGLKLGVEGGYQVVTRFEAPAVGGVTTSTNSYNIPIMALGKYTFAENIYGMLGAGVALSKISVSKDYADTVTEANKIAGDAAAEAGSTSTTNFAAMVGVGYSFALNEQMSIDPRAKFYMVFADTTASQIVPSVNFVYHF